MPLSLCCVIPVMCLSSTLTLLLTQNNTHVLLLSMIPWHVSAKLFCDSASGIFFIGERGRDLEEVLVAWTALDDGESTYMQKNTASGVRRPPPPV